MNVKLVCLDDEVFKAMVETIVKRIRENLPNQDPEVVDADGACALLVCKRTKLFELLKEEKIQKANNGKGHKLLILTSSIREYQQSLFK